MTPARLAALWARVAAHELACVALHNLARVWPGAIGRELRRMADQHARRAAFLKGMLRKEGP